MPLAHLRLIPLLAVVPLVGLSACGGPGVAEEVRADTPRQQVGVDDVPEVAEAVRATDRLGLGLLALGEEPNAVTSPASAAVALAMLAEGAGGTTADELDALLGASGEARGAAYNALTAQLAPLAGDPAVVQDDELPETPVVHLANAVVLDDQARVRQAYLERLAAAFDTGVRTTDLGSGEAKELLDAWVRENTGGLVEESAIQPEPGLRLVLQNAVVVAAAWATPFHAAPELPFTLPDGTEVDVEAMQVEVHPRYVEVSGWRAVRLPYRGGDLYADVILPPDGSGPADLDAELMEQLAEGLRTAQDSRPVHVTMPKVDLRTTTNLLPLLEREVPSVVVAETADLSGISEEPLFVSQAKQQATLTVDENGTIAAAVTELGMLAGSAPDPTEPVEMVVDRPFLFRVGEGRTDWTLFLARIADPR
jgi:serine protease inhibitor